MGRPGRSLTRRLRHERFCLTGGQAFGRSYSQRWRFNTSIFIAPDLSYLFAKNEKVANQSLRMTFQKLAAGGELPANFHTNRRWSGPLLQPSELPDLSLARLNDGSMFRFAVVRNPFSRVLSCYRSKFNKTTGKAPRFPRKLGLSHQAPFREFVEVVCRQEPLEMDPHWRIQYFNIFCDKIDYDAFVWFERLEADLGKIVQRFGGAGELLSIGKTTGASDRLTEYYDSYTERLVAEKFAPDFELFGYPNAISQLGLARDAADGRKNDTAAAPARQAGK